VVDASTWLAESTGSDRSYPQQCLGLAYVSLLRWQAAEQAFMAAHDALPESDAGGRARLAAMAGNAALADNRYQPAREHFELAQREAATAGDRALGGEIAGDRAQALVGLTLLDEAAAALADARRDAPQSSDTWLLSATLSRRQGKLAEAQAEIETGAALAPADPAIGLEAGVIAALSGRDEAARQSFNSVISLAPQSPQAATARGYLAQLGEAQPAR
jgi:tetratricopeptide (TPR) repeat protein